MTTNYAQIVTSEAWPGKPFGERLAVQFFGADIVAALPRKSKGANKGAHKATIRFRKVERGGWVRTGSDWDGSRGRVERRIASERPNGVLLHGQRVEVVEVVVRRSRPLQDQSSVPVAGSYALTTPGQHWISSS